MIKMLLIFFGPTLVFCGCARSQADRYDGAGADLRFVRDGYLAILSPNGDFRATLVHGSKGRIILFEPTKNFDSFANFSTGSIDFIWATGMDAYWNDQNQLVVMRDGVVIGRFKLDAVAGSVDWVPSSKEDGASRSGTSGAL